MARSARDQRSGGTSRASPAEDALFGRLFLGHCSISILGLWSEIFNMIFLMPCLIPFHGLSFGVAGQSNERKFTGKPEAGKKRGLCCKRDTLSFFRYMCFLLRGRFSGQGVKSRGIRAHRVITSQPRITMRSSTNFRSCFPFRTTATCQMEQPSILLWI